MRNDLKVCHGHIAYEAGARSRCEYTDPLQWRGDRPHAAHSESA